MKASTPSVYVDVDHGVGEDLTGQGKRVQADAETPRPDTPFSASLLQGAAGIGLGVVDRIARLAVRRWAAKELLRVLAHHVIEYWFDVYASAARLGDVEGAVLEASAGDFGTCRGSS
jgi:hypothetical protein